MKTALRLSLFAALLLGAAPLARAYEEKSLLAPNGTLYVVRAGSAADLGIAGNYARPDDNLIEWSSLAQDGSQNFGVLPGTIDSSVKHNLTLVFDEPSGTFLVLWKQEISLVNLLRLGILQGNQWKVSDLLPNVGFPHAYNPSMMITHPVVHSLDAAGKDVFTRHSLLSIIWWEESNQSLARYAPIFLDEDASTDSVQIYDLPASVGAVAGPQGAPPPAGAYQFPELQTDGPGGGILASFADPGSGQHFIVRINFPTDVGTPGPTNATWLRRRVPIVGIVESSPIARLAPIDGTVAVTTFIGSGYRPTLAWRDATSVHFLRFDGTKWSDVNSIALDDKTMSYDHAMALVQDMATKN